MTEPIRIDWALELLRDHKLGEPERGRLEVETEAVTDPNQVRKRLEQFGGLGWMCLTGEIVEVRAGRAIPPGTVLSAELAKGDESLHLRQSQTGWTLSRIAKAKGDGQLLFKEPRLRIGGGTLHYQVAWACDGDDGVWKPRCARLVGIEEG